MNTASSSPSDRNLLTSDIATNNSSTSKHGFLKKLSNTNSEFMDGAGDWVNPITVLSNPYKFSVYRNSAANTGNGAFAKITFDTELFDTNNNFATGTYTAPVAGFYQFNARASVNASHTRFILGLYKNGSAYHYGVDHNNAAVANHGASISCLIQLAASDTVEIQAFGNATLALEVGSTANTYFNGFLVSIT